MSSEFISNEQAREKLAIGIYTVAKSIESQFGPQKESASKPALLFPEEDPYIIMGKTLAKNLIIDINNATHNGTKTAIILLNAIIQSSKKHLQTKVSIHNLIRGIEKALEQTLLYLDSRTIPLKTDLDISHIASIASHSPQIGENISNAYNYANGIDTIIPKISSRASIEQVDGMHINQGYVSSYFITEKDKQEIDMSRTSVFIADITINSIQQLLPLLQSFSSKEKGLLIIARDFSEDVLATLTMNKLKGILNVAAIKAPSKESLEKIAFFTGASILSDSNGFFPITSSGHIDQVHIDHNSTIYDIILTTVLNGDIRISTNIHLVIIGDWGEETKAQRFTRENDIGFNVIRSVIIRQSIVVSPINDDESSGEIICSVVVSDFPGTAWHQRTSNSSIRKRYKHRNITKNNTITAAMAEVTFNSSPLVTAPKAE